METTLESLRAPFQTPWHSGRKSEVAWSAMQIAKNLNQLIFWLKTGHEDGATQQKLAFLADLVDSAVITSRPGQSVSSQDWPVHSAIWDAMQVLPNFPSTALSHVVASGDTQAILRFLQDLEGRIRLVLERK